MSGNTISDDVAAAIDRYAAPATAVPAVPTGGADARAVTAIPAAAASTTGVDPIRVQTVRQNVPIITDEVDREISTRAADTAITAIRVEDASVVSVHAAR